MMKFIDLNAQYAKVESAIQARLKNVFASGAFIKGPEVGELEQKLAQFCGTKHCVAVGNGTDALQLALMALDVGPGDEVIVPDFTFIAPAEMVALIGAKVVLVDVDPRTYNLDAQLLEQAITPKTKAIISVSLYGQCSDFDAINAVAQKHNISVIEDAAQSFGATYKGQRSCNLSTIACTSFFPTKPLGCYGDGGACFANDDKIAARIRRLGNHGDESKYMHVMVGMNSRLDTMQAAVLLSKLEIFEWEIEQRNKFAKMYSEQLEGHVQVPFIEAHNTSVFAQYTIAVKNRDEVCAHLQKNGVPTAIHYPRALHQQPALAEICRKSNELANAAHAAQCVFSLPFHPYMQEDEVKHVADLVKEVA